MENKSGWTLGRISWIAASTVLVIGFLISSTQLFEDVKGGEIVVIQYPWTGEQKVFTQPGVAMQWFGTVTHYPKRVQYSFNKDCKSVDEGAFPSERIRFAEGGHANLCGSISWEMPLDPKNILRLHNEFGSHITIERQLIGKAVQSAIYVSGPMMTSTESSGPKRSELFTTINDQTLNGIYQTTTKTIEREDPVTKAKSVMTVTEILKGENGAPKRMQGSAVAAYGIVLLPLNLSAINYDDVIEKQIAQRQQAATQVEISAAKARQAEQEATQAEQEGRKEATKAKWAQETINAKELASAQQKVASQELATKAAELYKKEQVLRGEGDAAYKRLVMEADGALDPKLKAYVEVNARYADAIQKYAGQWVPSVQMGASGSTPGGAALPLIDLLTAKTAKELGLKTELQGKDATAKGK